MVIMKEGEMKRHLVMKGLALTVLSSVFGSCQAREGGVMVIRPSSHSPFQSAAPVDGAPDKTPPLPLRGASQIEQKEELFNGTSRSVQKWEQIIQTTGKQTSEVDDATFRLHLLCRDGRFDEVLREKGEDTLKILAENGDPLLQYYYAWHLLFNKDHPTPAEQRDAYMFLLISHEIGRYCESLEELSYMGMGDILQREDTIINKADMLFKSLK